MLLTICRGLPRRSPDSMCTPALPEPSHEERILTDVSIVGIAVRGPMMDLARGGLHEGITPSNRLDDLDQGARVSVAGLVAVRQSPETAKGFVFHTLEDGFGLLNVITRPDLVPKYREIIERAPAIIVHGHIERQERATNVIAERFQALTMSREAARGIHDFG